MVVANQAAISTASRTAAALKRTAKDNAWRGEDARTRLLALPEDPRPDHAADALAVAICHANSAPLRAALGRHGALVEAGA